MAGSRDRALLHRFEEGGLRFGRRPLISSARTMLANSGPFMNLNWRDSSRISEPTSEGIKSGVNWMRLKLRPRAWAMVTHEEGFSEAGHADQQHVATGRRCSYLLDHVLLPYDYLAYLR